LSLPENLDVLIHLEKIGKLPRALIIFQLTTPNNDNGQYILNYNQELPRDILLNASDPNVSPEQKWFASMGWLGSIKWHYENVWRPIVDQAMSYSSFFVSLFTQASGDRTFDVRVCSTVSPTLFRGSRFGIGKASFQGIGIRLSELDQAYGRTACNPNILWGAFRPDGTWDPDFYIRTTLTLNENELSEKDRYLNPGDETDIARYMTEAAEIAKRNNIKIAFLIPPVFESDRYSTVDEVMTKALALVPQLTVLDHRHKHREAENFFNYDHENERYFQIVVGELVSRGLVSASTESRTPSDRPNRQ
jgi:hypothetical protein